MTRRILDKKTIDVSCLEFLDEFNNKAVSKWNSDSSNEESYFAPKSEVLWSREKSDAFLENDFFQGFHDKFSDLTEGTTSSCSWHNDDFDMDSSNKVNASLEAVEDALYDKQASPLISKSVYQECCDWSNKFPYFRLKGKQIIESIDDSATLYNTQRQNEDFETPLSSLQVEGRKMAIHAQEKMFKKDNFNKIDSLEHLNSFDDIFEDDGDYEECLVLNTKDTCNTPSQTLFKNELQGASSISALQEKIIERIALEMWPKVVGILQEVNEANSRDLSEVLQLPPIVPMVEQRQIAFRRPRTEGTDLSVTDFSQLSSILTISPKVLQKKHDNGSWKAIPRSSRPNSEIHLSRRNQTVTGLRKSNTSDWVTETQNLKHFQASSTKMAIKEKEHEKLSLYLPAVEEDSPEPAEIFRGLSAKPGIKDLASPYEITRFSKKPESFLPPIDRKNHMPSNLKLTRNLFSFFGSQLKTDRDKGNLSKVHPSSRPNTSTSRKVVKYSGNTSHRFLDGNSVINNSNLTEMKLREVDAETQVTLFPIVTSLVPNKEKTPGNVKKGLLKNLGIGRR